MALYIFLYSASVSQCVLLNFFFLFTCFSPTLSTRVLNCIKQSCGAHKEDVQWPNVNVYLGHLGNISLHILYIFYDSHFTPYDKSQVDNRVSRLNYIFLSSIHVICICLTKLLRVVGPSPLHTCAHAHTRTHVNAIL